jgi:hypothetical protein
MQWVVWIVEPVIEFRFVCLLNDSSVSSGQCSEIRRRKSDEQLIQFFIKRVGRGRNDVCRR